MPKHRRLESGTPWVELSTTAADWKSADPALLAGMLAQLHLIRAFEETVLELAGEGLVHGPAHSSIGQEGGAVGSIIGLRSTDAINGSHRGHHQFLAKALTHVGGIRSTSPTLVTPEIQEVLQRTLAEILGLAQGYCRGRGGSMHLQWFEAGALGTNAIVGGGAPMATGNAWAQKHSDTTDLTINYFGDGASQIGSVLESMNLAATWKLPVAFFIENNLYGVSTHVSEITADTRLSVRGQGFGIPSWRVDGMDPLAVHLAMNEAAEHMRSGAGPAVVEAEVYRFFHQNGPYPGSAFGYRTQAGRGGVARARPAAARRRRDAEARPGHRGRGRSRCARRRRRRCAPRSASCSRPIPRTRASAASSPTLWPEPEFVDVGLRGDASELADARTLDPATEATDMTPSKFVDAVAAVMGRRMEQDERIVVLGEDVHRLSGGTNGATKGLAARFPDRVLGTPISENAFAGLAGGMALDGRFRPVVEFMYPDFMWVAADQVFNQIGKARHMFGGVNPVPLVLRTKVAMGSGYGSQHLMDPAGIFATSPGWRIIAPSTAADYVGLMNAALALEDPVLVIEHVDLYGRADEIPEGDLDYQLPFGKAALPPRGRGRHDHQLPLDGAPLRRGGRSDRAGRRRHRPALARPGLARLGDDRRVDQEDQRRADRRAGRAGHVVRRLARRRDPAPLLRLARSARGAGDRQRGEPEHLEGARARGDRPHRRGRGRHRAPARRNGRCLMATTIRMPEVLTGVTEAAIATWLVAVGQKVEVGTPLAEIETDKAVVEYASEIEGTVLELLAAEGAGVAIGDPIVVVGRRGSHGAGDAPTPRSAPVTGDEPASRRAGDEPPVPSAPVDARRRSRRAARRRRRRRPVPTPLRDERRFVSPLVRRLARERGIDLSAIAGTGPERPDRAPRHRGGGCRASLRRRTPPQPPPRPPARPARGIRPRVARGGFDEVPLTGMRRAIARRLTESKSTVPHFYLVADCRVDRLLELRREVNEAHRCASR